MAAPIGIQLYTVRAEAEKGYADVVRKIAEMGYVGVEPAGFPGTTAEAAGKLFKELGLQVPSAHVKLPLGDDKNEILDIMHAIDGKCMVCSYRPPEDYSSVDRIKATCDTLNQAAAVAAENGMQFGYHNHWFEYQKLDGRNINEIALEYLDPSVLFEIDTYWVKVGGQDPLTVVKALGDRAPLLHIKDGPADKKESDMTAVGQGVMDFKTLIPAATSAEWLIVELDRCATDMMTAVKESYDYLIGEGLARGNHN
ncbi:MAG: sugar phosphate isomerase/epimerase [Anaerolineae bacterium]|nr:sugar phosphate isomerase/epimerase [Anaerolineae bacterium]